MATWKKVIVSGSNISQLNNDAGYITQATLVESNAFATASFNGTNLLADSPSGVLNFASSSGQGLTIAANSGNDTLTFGLSAIPNNSLANSSIIVGGTTINLGATVTTVDGLTLTNAIGSGSFSGSFQGDGSGLTGIASTLAISGSTGNGTVSLKTQALSVVGTANEIETSVSGQTVTIGLPDSVTVTNDLTVGGNLTVNGTVTTLNTQDLLIEDRWALFASGSTGPVDGGIIVNNNSNGSGYALGVQASATRWALQNNLAGTATTITPDSFMTTTQYGLASAIPAAPQYGGSSNGYGNIWVSTDTEEIYIWS